MATFESDVKTVPAPVEAVYGTLSDLNNLSKLEERIPADKLNGLAYDTDSCRFSVAPVGEVAFRIVDREENKTIKFETERSPVPGNLWVQLLPADDETTKLKLTVKAELNPFLKGMVAKPLQEGLNKLAELLTAIPY